MLDPPCTQVSESSGGELAAQVARDYGLGDGGRWRVRVYSGYSRYDKLIHELAG